MKYNNKQQAVLLLKDGTIFYGKSIGISGTTFGEIAFNTGTTGYQEIFTDPSYFGQIMVTTNAHIGNYGVNVNEVESDLAFCCYCSTAAIKLVCCNAIDGLTYINSENIYAIAGYYNLDIDQIDNLEQAVGEYEEAKVGA
jgi:carbamoylphosphate synthase small subunit